MPDLKLKPVTARRLNKPAWYRPRTAELAPDHKAGEGAASLVTTDVNLDGERIGSTGGTQTQHHRPRMDLRPDRRRHQPAPTHPVPRRRRARPHAPHRPPAAPHRAPRGCRLTVGYIVGPGP